MPGMAIGAVARKPSDAVAGDGGTRGEIGDHQRQQRAAGGGQRAQQERVLHGELGGGELEEHEADVVQRSVFEVSSWEGMREKAALSSAP